MTTNDGTKPIQYVNDMFFRDRIGNRVKFIDAT